ncbi:MAG: TIGR02710 family CRISPR-associated CARF protein [bacterium]
MKKALIVTVGTGKDVENGIAFSIKQNNPSHLLFIKSDKSEKTLAEVLRLLGKSMDDPNIQIETQNEVDDVEILISAYSAYVVDLVKKGYAADEISVDFTSGTKAMSAAIVYAALNRNIGSLCYVHGKRGGEGGRVLPGTERLKTIRPVAIFMDQKIALFKALFNMYQFEAALILFKDKIIHDDFKETVSFLTVWSEAYSAWDKFDFTAASEKLNSIGKKVPLPDEFKYLKAIKEKHKQVLNKLKNSKWDYCIAADLLSNAYRRHEEGKYDDAVARLYRTLELIGQIEFFNTFKDKLDQERPTSNIPWGLVPEILRPVLLSNRSQDGTVNLGLRNVFRFLDATGNEKVKAYLEKEGEFIKVTGTRNDSILAHGLRPVNKIAFENYFELIRGAFDLKQKTDFPEIK